MDAPSPILDCARVIAYAEVGLEIPFRQAFQLYVGGELLGRVPALAICINLRDESDVLLFHCDSDWNVLGAGGATSVDAAKDRAEANYPGISACWRHMDTTLGAAMKYFDDTWPEDKCSFCGKRSFEIEHLISGDHAAICEGCVQKYFEALSSSRGGAGSG